MSVPAYPEYKDSDVEWLGEVPAHWEVTRLKKACEVFPSNVDKKSVEGQTAVRLCNYTDVYYNDVISADMPFMEATATVEQIARFTLRRGDTIFTKDSETADDIARSAFVPEDMLGVVCGYHLSIARPLAATVGAFVKYLFDSAPARAYFQVKANGLTRVGLGQYAVDNVPIALPPPTEQAVIAGFLDRETGKIDALVEEQRRLIALLKEKRQAVISHAVTKGLNPQALLKPSGIEWPNEIPSNWNLLPLTRLVSQFVDYRGATPTKVDEGVPLVTATQIKRGRIDHSLDPVYITEQEYATRMTRGFPARGDLLLTTEAPLGEVALVEEERIAPGQRIILMKVNSDRVTSKFLLTHFQSDFGKKELWMRASGSTASGIRADRLRASLVLVPPLREQQAIVAHVQAVTSSFDDIEHEANTQIALLQERRAALISAAVTGKIDVRGLEDALGTMAAA